MAFLEINHPLRQLIAQISADEGLSVYDIELANNSLLKVMVTKNKTDLGVSGHLASATTSGDCTRLCRRLMVVLYAEGKNYGLSAEPEIEVSSPGINRPLRLPEHFASAVGERIKVITHQPLDLDRSLKFRDESGDVEKAGTKLSTFHCVLDRVADSVLYVTLENENERKKKKGPKQRELPENPAAAVLLLPLAEIKRAHVDFRF